MYYIQVYLYMHIEIAPGKLPSMRYPQDAYVLPPVLTYKFERLGTTWQCFQHLVIAIINCTVSK